MTAAGEHQVTVSQVGGQVRDFIEAARTVWKGIAVGLGHLAIYAKRSDLVEQAGWLPHAVAPFEMIPLDHSSEQVDALLGEHYRENWSAIRTQFASRVGGYEIDGEAKDSYLEALQLHELGHYRAVVRVLFPEIERVAWKEVYSGGQDRRDRITSLKALREAVGRDLGFSEMGDMRYALRLFQRMSEHLYAKVGDDQASIEKYEADPVPNRHAAIHGIVIYKTPKNSINTLIMADFMFQAIHALKTVRERRGDGD